MDSEIELLGNGLAPLPVHDFSPLSMFMEADWVVRMVMVALIVASIISWTIAFAKIFEITVARRKARRALQSVLNARTFACLASCLKGQTGVGVLFFEEALKEIALSTHCDVLVIAQVMKEEKGEKLTLGFLNDGIKERVHSLLLRCLLTANQRIVRGHTILATIGAIAPFVGLFATVWGIMNSFIGIAKEKTTQLDVVAPGIAEALLATALGLFVAIPAVIMYNFLSCAFKNYRSDLADVAAAIERLLSRDIDFQKQQKSFQK
ncbi:tonB-system energizer ExbB [Bartonella ancashensis]|uniref:Biopolymer transport protein ExbB n=1 Tax=Bartonella ancashensis TaxID=1318743 RepID=A0A0M4M540_9HYPH|nr:tonB-system energizer ExbB [Bartonella ancashensis]ALE03104.1 MotA/TolQ/ExbB proton channel family protein [Bartonella ancashensis]